MKCIGFSKERVSFKLHAPIKRSGKKPTLNPKPKTLNPKTLNPKLPASETLHPASQAKTRRSASGAAKACAEPSRTQAEGNYRWGV